MTLDEFINKYNGKATDYDKTCGTQCVDLVKMYCDYVLGLGNFYVGNAIDWYNTYSSNSNLKNNFSRIANTASFIPQKRRYCLF